MSPPPLALRPLLDEEVNWRLKAEAMVGSFSVLEEEPVGELAVEGGQVVEQQVFMIVHELFLEGAVEAFRVGVHFRGAGVRPPVRDAAFLQAVLEVAEERRAVVGEHVAWGDWQEMAQGVQRRGIPASLGDRLLPAIEGTPAHLIRIVGGRRAVRGPELENLQSVLSIVGSHAPKMPELGYSGKPPDAGAEVVDVHGTPPGWECQRFLNLYSIPER